MFTIPGLMSFWGTAPHLNLLLALSLRHCGDSLISRSPDVASRLEQLERQDWTCWYELMAHQASSRQQAIEKRQR